MSDKDIEADLKGKKALLDYMVKNNINDIQKVGRVISEYYTNPELVLRKIKGPGKIKWDETESGG